VPDLVSPISTGLEVRCPGAARRTAQLSRERASPLHQPSSPRNRSSTSTIKALAFSSYPTNTIGYDSPIDEETGKGKRKTRPACPGPTSQLSPQFLLDLDTDNDIDQIPFDSTWFEERALYLVQFQFSPARLLAVRLAVAVDEGVVVVRLGALVSVRQVGLL